MSLLFLYFLYRDKVSSFDVQASLDQLTPEHLINATHCHTGPASLQFIAGVYFIFLLF